MLASQYPSDAYEETESHDKKVLVLLMKTNGFTQPEWPGPKTTLMIQETGTVCELPHTNAFDTGEHMHFLNRLQLVFML